MGRRDAQVFELLFGVAEALGLSRDRDLAQLVGVSPETIQNWRTGAVGELKPAKLTQVEQTFAARIAALRERAGLSDIDRETGSGMTQLHIAPEASPSEIQRQLRDRMHYDYLGHRFLYFEPQGALAWENLIRGGYEQSSWLAGVEGAAAAWIAHGKGREGRGPIAASIGLGRRGRTRGLDVVSLGPGEGGKEVALLSRLAAAEEDGGAPPWRSLTLVDVSIPLLIRAALATRRAVAELPFERSQVTAVCSDFEEGPLDFARHLPSERHDEDAGRRLVVVLGNVFGNVRHEDTFVRQKLSFLTRPGDFVWIEVAIRAERPELDPIYRLTQPLETETAAEANRRLLLEGPYRRYEAALGRQHEDLKLRVWVRQDDDSATVPGSYNFCHDLVLASERRAITMLYSRRYDLDELGRWFEQRGYAVERVRRVPDSRKVDRVAHILLRRTDRA